MPEILIHGHICPEMQIAFINTDCLRGNGRLTLRHWAELSDFGYLEAADAESIKDALEAARQIYFALRYELATEHFSRQEAVELEATRLLRP